jgi:hypothetical protein
MNMRGISSRVTRLEGRAAALPAPATVRRARISRRIGDGTATRSDFEFALLELGERPRERLVVIAVEYALDRGRRGSRAFRGSFLAAAIVSHPPNEEVPQALRRDFAALCALRTRPRYDDDDDDLGPGALPELWLAENVAALILEVEERQLRVEVADRVAISRSATGPSTSAELSPTEGGRSPPNSGQSRSAPDT